MFGQSVKPKKINVSPIDGQTQCSDRGNPCSIDITEKWKEFKNFQDIKDAANELFIRFNTAPHLYTKKDYFLLLLLLSKGLEFVYNDGLELGDNFGSIAEINNGKLELTHPVARRGSIVRDEDAASTLASVEYLSHYTLQWEEF